MTLLNDFASVIVGLWQRGLRAADMFRICLDKMFDILKVFDSHVMGQ